MEKIRLLLLLVLFFVITTTNAAIVRFDYTGSVRSTFSLTTNADGTHQQSDPFSDLLVDYAIDDIVSGYFIADTSISGVNGNSVYFDLLELGFNELTYLHPVISPTGSFITYEGSQSSTYLNEVTYNIDPNTWMRSDVLQVSLFDSSVDSFNSDEYLLGLDISDLDLSDSDFRLQRTDWYTNGQRNTSKVGVSINSISVTAVPEPSTLALMGFGLVGLGFARRRKQQA